MSVSRPFWACWFFSMAVVVTPVTGLATATDPDPESAQSTASSDAVDSATVLEKQALKVLLNKADKSKDFVAEELAMIEQFADQSNMNIEWIWVDHPWQLVPELLAGAGDVIVGQGASITGGMTGQVSFTSAWTNIGQQVVARTDTTEIDSLEDLQSRQIAIKKSSPHWDNLSLMASKYRSMDLLIIPEYVDQETVMQRVATGQYDVTIAESHFLENYLPHHKELSVAFDLSDRELKAWAVRPDAEPLLAELNQFLNKNHLHMKLADVHLNDLPNMRLRKKLRVITYQSPANYYFNQGRFEGFEYELIKEFAETQNMRVDVILANTHQQMQELLVKGQGDIIAASLPVGSINNDNIVFSKEYNYSSPVIIGRTTDTNIIDIRELEGRRIILPAESPYWNLLRKIKQQGIEFEMTVVDKGISAASTLYMISKGMYDLTIMDNLQFKSINTDADNVKALFALGEPAPIAWAVRSSDTLLLFAVNKFVKENYRHKFYNTLYSKYFEKQNFNNRAVFAGAEPLSPYDGIVKQYAEKYGFDWRLIVAQMYQESQFDPQAVSYAGAEGLMQIMPGTAADLKTRDVYDPTSSIRSGVKYLGMLRDQFENNLLLEEKTWFSLASYNAGFNRIQRARLLAEEMGLDKNKWFDNVENAMLILARPYTKDGELVRDCRCGQTVVYVQEIRSLYNNYVRLTQSAQIASNEPEEIHSTEIFN